MPCKHDYAGCDCFYGGACKHHYNDGGSDYNGNQEAMGAAGGGLFVIVIYVVFGVFAAFLFPSIKISRAEDGYDPQTGAPEFSGTLWLFLSPVFGFLSNMLFGMIFMVWAAAMGGVKNIVVATAYQICTFGIYVLAIGLALLTFLFKNRKSLMIFLKHKETRTTKKTGTIAGAAAIALLVCCLTIGIGISAVNAFMTARAAAAAITEKEQNEIKTAAANYDYEGRYLLEDTKNDVFVVKRDSGSEANLRLAFDDPDRKSVKESKPNSGGCLLTPFVSDDLGGRRVMFRVNDCVVEGKRSPLESVYFDGKNKMFFSFEGKHYSPSLKKIK